VGTSEGALIALNSRDGVERWHAKVNGEVLSAPDDKIAGNERAARIAGELAAAEFDRAAAENDRTCALGDVLDLVYGKALPAARRRPGAIPVYGSGGVSGTHDRPLVDGPGVVVGRKGTVGSVH